MRSAVAILSALALSAPAAALAAGWRYADWGMTPAQVIAASKGEVSSFAEPIDSGPARQELQAYTVVEDARFELVFGFEDGKLAEVRLTPPSPALCPRLKIEIEGARGTARRTEATQSAITYHWRDDLAAADVSLTDYGDDDRACVVAYRPAALRAEARS